MWQTLDVYLNKWHDIIVTLANLTETCLPGQPTLWVVIGYPTGHSHPTAGGAGRPISGLQEALGWEEGV